MENKNYNYMGAIALGIAIVMFGVIFSFSAYNFSKLGSYAEVKGLSEKIVKADTANWVIGFDVKSNSTEGLYSDLEKNTNTIKSFLYDAGFDDSEINMAPVNTYQDTYRDALFRYNAMAQISVYTNKVDAVKEASKNTLPLIQKGVVINQSYVNFSIADINSFKPEMLAESIANAKVSAEEFAKASNSSVGKISRANQGVIDITEKDPGSPEYKKVRVVSTLRFLLK